MTRDRNIGRHEAYWLGYRHGKTEAAWEAEHGSRHNIEARLRLEVALCGNNRHRAFALGELRGYRQARHD